MVDQVPIVLESWIGRYELDVLLWQDSVDELTKELATIKLLDSPKENILAFEGIGDYYPGQSAWLDEGLDDGASMADSERG